jgi:hypothetical protein
MVFKGPNMGQMRAVGADAMFRTQMAAILVSMAFLTPLEAVAQDSVPAVAAVAPAPISRPILRLKPKLPVQTANLAQQGVEPDVFIPPASWTPEQAREASVAAAAQKAMAPAAAKPPAPPTALRIAQAAPAAMTAPAKAADTFAARPPSAFIGRYLGSGTELALPGTVQIGEPPRRMSQVEISGNDDAFTVSWSTMKLGSNFKPVPVKSSEQSLTFRRTATPNFYKAEGAADVAPGQPTAWARLKGDTMTVVKMELLASGAYAVQHYERTLTQAGMDVLFTRFEDGAVVRSVKLSLAKGPSSSW